MAITNYSHAFLVGSVNHVLDFELLDNDSRWKRMTLAPEDYDNLCAMYYKSYVDAVCDTPETVRKPETLRCIRHYQCDVAQRASLCTTVVGKMSVVVSPVVDYQLTVCSLHLYLFPFNTALFAVEIDESGFGLNGLIDAHKMLMSWKWEEFSPMTKQQLGPMLSPLAPYLPEKKLANMVTRGNKLKLFQVHQLEVEPFADTDALLYEIATTSPISSVHTKGGWTPSPAYYHRIMSENSVSVFNNWKAMALVDSFTVISTDEQFNSWPFVNLYFPLIYLRCLFEKAFCFSRNNDYRQDKECVTLLSDISEMERFYFYDNISFNFLPVLINQAMAKGLGIKEEREELSEQIKERAKEEETDRKDREEKEEHDRQREEEWRKETEEKRRNNILIYVSFFAVFSVIWDICSIVMEAFPCWNKSLTAIIHIIVGIGLFVFFVWQIRRSKGRNYRRSIFISSKVREHLALHFRKGLPGSKFFSRSPEEVLDKGMKLFPKIFQKAKPDDDGKISISLVFPETIGTCNVVSMDELTAEEKNKIEVVDRQGKKVRSVRTDRVITTKECQIILTDDWQLITMFPGENAPSLPDSPDISNDYWDRHVFIEPFND